MPAPDTNVLVLYLVQDHPGQLVAAKRLIGRNVAEGGTLFVPVTVAHEVNGSCGPASHSAKTTC